MDYILIIKYASFAFPIVAFLFTFPHILMQYHKYGSISFLKSIIIYLFIYYLICAYFLVILPLPKISEVLRMTTPRVQLIPFDFVLDFINNSSFYITDIHTYIPAFFESYVYVPLFNIFLTIPFGMFLRYYFEFSLKKVFVFSFLLSLFFELTQLSGLYFIYPRGYRLFDVDDLILNTIGGILGYFILNLFIKYLPKISEINSVALKHGQKITGFKRTTSCILDIFIFLVLYLFVTILFKGKNYFYFTVFLYYFIFPIVLKGSTIGEKFLNLKIVDYSLEFNYIKLLIRRIIFIFIYFFLPIISVYILSSASFSYLKLFVFLIFFTILIIFYIISFIKFLFSNKQMLYEKISNTKLVSTIK